MSDTQETFIGTVDTSSSGTVSPEKPITVYESGGKLEVDIYLKTIFELLESSPALRWGTECGSVRPVIKKRNKLISLIARELCDSPRLIDMLDGIFFDVANSEEGSKCIEFVEEGSNGKR